MSFNLLNKPVLLVRWRKDGQVSEVSIADALRNAADIGELADSSPLVVTVQLRLLSAILYRLSPIRTRRQWKTLYDAGQFDTKTLDDYFSQWHDRFDLFGERPFMQCADLRTEKPAPLSKMAPELVSGNNATLFDHNEDDAGTAYRPTDSFNMLLVAQGYGLGGLLKAKGTIDNKEFSHPSATDSVIARGISLYLAGDNLFQTLLLNLAPNPGDSTEDAPCWENELDNAYFDRTAPDGMMDRYTYLSRRILLIPEKEESGEIVVRRMYYTQGRAVDKSLPDAMQCYQQSKKGGMIPVLLSENKATWRDLTALLQLNSKDSIPAAALSFVGRLVNEGMVERRHRFQLHITGMSSDKAKVTLWRHDQVPLPAAFLDEEALVATLSNQFKAADGTAELLWKRIRSLCWHFFAPVKDQMSPDTKNVSALAKQIDSRRTYWARLEAHLPELLRQIADGKETAEVAEWWEEQANTAATEAMHSAIERLGPSPRAWRAAAAVSPYFGKRKEKENGE
jgi:CRISPR system Cascade subunit CasA